MELTNDLLEAITKICQGVKHSEVAARLKAIASTMEVTAEEVIQPFLGGNASSSSDGGNIDWGKLLIVVETILSDTISVEEKALQIVQIFQEIFTQWEQR